MSCRSYIKGAVGCLCLEDKLWTTETVESEGCSHTFDKENFLFCPHCGTKSFIKTTVRTSNYIDDINYEICDRETFKHLDFKITFMPNETHDSYYSEYVVLGLKTTEKSEDLMYNNIPRYMFLPVDPEIKEKTKAVLEPLGLWDEDTFGFYAIGEVSC